MVQSGLGQSKLKQEVCLQVGGRERTSNWLDHGNEAKPRGRNQGRGGTRRRQIRRPEFFDSRIRGETNTSGRRNPEGGRAKDSERLPKGVVTLSGRGGSKKQEVVTTVLLFTIVAGVGEEGGGRREDGEQQSSAAVQNSVSQE